MMEGKRVRVTQIGSAIRRPKNQGATLRALGLGRVGREVVCTLTPSTIGMLRTVNHLVRAREVTE